MVGGSGERKTLRLVATYADACNMFASADQDGPATVAAKFDVLREHCERIGRPYEEIDKTILFVGQFDPTTAVGGAQFVEVMRGYAEVGVTRVYVMPAQDPIAYVAGIGEHVVPALSNI